MPLPLSSEHVFPSLHTLKWPGISTVTTAHAKALAHMSGSAAWRQLMTRFCGRSSRVRAADGRSSSVVGLASRGEMYQPGLMFVARPSAILLSASSLPMVGQLIKRI